MARHVKDPNDVLDYGHDFAAWLDGDTITDHDITVTPDDAVTVDSSSVDGDRVIVWLSGGVLDADAEVTFRIVTAGGRTTDRTDRFDIRKK